MTVHCDQFPALFPGVGMKNTPLANRVQEISYDADTWTTLFECLICGTAWQEAYEETGHGEVPFVQRLGSADDPAE